MEILGYIAYIILICLAFIWALGVRLKLGTGLHTIIGSLFFTLSAVIIPIIKASFLHAIWLIPVGYLLPLIIAYILPRFKVLSRPLVLIGSIYAGVLRFGIDKNKIQQAQREATFEAVESWAEKQKRKT